MMAVGMYEQGASIIAMILATFLLNFRHLIMSTCVFERIKEATLKQKLIAGFGVTDESFALFTTEKEDGSMDFETAEVISSLVSAKLDELDPIEHEYILDVCSPGAERPIRNKDEFIANLNRYITVYLTNKDENNKDSYTGDLLEVNGDYIVISYKDKTRVKQVNVKFENVKKAHVAIKF